MEDAVGRKRVALAESEGWILQVNEVLVGFPCLGVAGKNVSCFHEGENLQRLQAAIVLSLLRAEVVRIPATPARRFVVEVDEFPAILGDVSGDPREVAFRLFDFLSL